MTRPGRATAIVLAVGALFCLARAHFVGISDPSEGRYVQIAWEMVTSGDWITPRWNGIPHLEKPPLAYWAGAVGMTVFGTNEFGARILSTLALITSAVLLAGIARRVAGPKSAPAAAAFCLLPYPVALGCALLTDGFLLLATVLFYDALFRRMEEGSRRALNVVPVALAIGTLAKGQAILLFTVLPFLFMRTGFFWEIFRPARLLLLLALVVPWIVAIQGRYPDFLALHTGKLAAFVATGKQHHHDPPYIYLVAVLAGMFPFTLWASRGIRGLPRPHARVLALWFGLPFVFLSLVPSRSWTYILSSTPVVALLGARGIELGAITKARLSDGRIGMAGGVIGLAVVLIGRGRFVPPDVVIVGLILSATFFVTGSTLWFLAKRSPRLTAVILSGLLTLGLAAATMADEPAFRIYRGLARRVGELAGPRGGVAIVAAKMPSVPFYLGRFVTVAALDDRLAKEALLWGGSPWFRPDLSIERVLRENRSDVIIVDGKWHAQFAPTRTVLHRAGEFVVLAPDSAPRDDPPR